MTRIFTFFANSRGMAHVLMAVLTACMLTLPYSALADETTDEDTQPKAWCKLLYNNRKLVFYYGNKPTDASNYWEVDTTSTEKPGWYNKLNLYMGSVLGYDNAVYTVEFDPSFINVHPVSTAFWFEKFVLLTNINGLEYLNTEKVTTMERMFAWCEKLSGVDLSHFNTSNVTTMLGMFGYCYALGELDLTSFNTSNVENMTSMFYYCSAVKNIYVSDNFTTDKVTESSGMFDGCYSLEGHGAYDESKDAYLTAERANFTKKWGYLKTYYKVGDTKHEYYGIAPLTVDNLALEDGADFVNYSTFTATQATYTRTMPSTYGTLCLPFAIDTESTTGCSFYALDNVSTDKIELTLLTGTIEAGTPILVYSANKNINIAASNVAVIKTPAEGTKAGEWQLKGTFTQTSVPDDSYIISNNKFWLASELKSATTGSTVKSKGLRAWLTDSSDGGNKAKALSISTGETTSIDVIDALSNGKAEIYDIQGRRIDSLQKGLNIVKTGSATKKIIVK